MNHQFTGKERDAETGLDNVGHRISRAEPAWLNVAHQFLTGLSDHAKASLKELAVSEK